MEKLVNVAAVMTAPRYEAVYARNQIEHALQAVGIPLAISGGVFYGQCMQRMFSDVCSRDAEYVLTVDFDSMFTAAHVRRLLNIIVQEDEIDALAAAQPMRGKGRMLASNHVHEEIEWTGRPIKVATAHFGLTIISCERLRKLAKPWFCSVPDPEGDWGDGKIDDDVSFWKQWENAGNSLYVDPGTRLGHLEEMITVFDEQMNPQHLYPKEWEATRDRTVD